MPALGERERKREREEKDVARDFIRMIFTR